MAPLRTMTLIDVVQTISEYNLSNEEVVVTVAYQINSGRVLLCVTFAGPRKGMFTHSMRAVSAGFHCAALR